MIKKLFQVSEYQSGFDWATEQLRKGACEAEIERTLESQGEDLGSFASGAEDALKQYREEMGRSV